MKEIFEKIEEQNRWFDEIYERLGNIYSVIPTRADFGIEEIENKLFELHGDVKDLNVKLDYIIELLQTEEQ